jgi:hypothetical protein
MGAKAMPKR